MQRRVSLVFSDQALPVKKQSSNSNLQSQPLEHSESVFAISNPSCPMFTMDHHSQQHHHHLTDLRHKLLNAPRKIKTSFDDIDLLHETERRGSVPMVGSLIYYKRKNEEVDPNYTTKPPEPAVNESKSSNKALVKSIDQDLKVFRHFSTPEMIKDHIPIYPHLHFHQHTDNSEKPNEGSKKDQHNFLKFDNFCPEQDEFNMINSKIHSQIKKNTQKFNEFVHEQRERSKFGRHHFHIPGIDPESNDDSRESLNSTASNGSSGITSMSKKSNSSPHLNSHSEKKHATPDQNHFLDDSLQEHIHSPNNRHRRRLTCAMIFTPPKVVEI